MNESKKKLLDEYMHKEYGGFLDISVYEYVTLSNAESESYGFMAYCLRDAKKELNNSVKVALSPIIDKFSLIFKETK